MARPIINKYTVNLALQILSADQATVDLRAFRYDKNILVPQLFGPHLLCYESLTGSQKSLVNVFN